MSTRITIVKISFFTASICFTCLSFVMPTAAVHAEVSVQSGTQVTAAASFFEPFDTIDTKRWYISNGWTNGNWQGCTWSRTNLAIKDGALQLRLTKERNALRDYKCAELRTYARYGYGLYEARLRTASGGGLNTTLFTYSGQPLTPVHDEIDFEFLGKAPRNVQLNYYGAGEGGHESSEALGSDASGAFRTYAFEWTPTALNWYIDGRLVRTAAGRPQPSTPGQLFLSLWVGSAQVNNWLGTYIDKGNPVIAEVDWIAYTAPGERCKFSQSLSCNRP